MRFIKGNKGNHERFDHKGLQIWAYPGDSLHIGGEGGCTTFENKDAKKLVSYLSKVLRSKKESGK